LFNIVSARGLRKYTFSLWEANYQRFWSNFSLTTNLLGAHK
jgi:hypothetical protein